MANRKKKEGISPELPNDVTIENVLNSAENPHGVVMDSAETHEDGSMTLAKDDVIVEVPADAIVIPKAEIDSTIPPDLIAEQPVAVDMIISSVTPDTFNETAYLAAYPDVQQAVVQGQFESGLDHYNKYGKAEGR